MSTAVRVRPHTGLLVMLALVAVVTDQLSKAWFVYTLGSHEAADFVSFCEGYFQLFAGWDPQAGGMVVQTYFPFKPSIILWDPWLRWNLVTNTGAAWSMFAGNSFALSGVSIVMAIALCVIWNRYFKFHYGMTWALGAIIGGALGNFIDRFRLQEVVDFIDVRLPLIGQLFPKLGHPYNFPIFNVADSCAVCGTLALAGYLILSDIRHLREKRRIAEARAAEAERNPAFDPHQRSPEEIEQVREAVQKITRQVRSGESFMPRSRSDMPLGLSGEALPSAAGAPQRPLEELESAASDGNSAGADADISGGNDIQGN